MEENSFIPLSETDTLHDGSAKSSSREKQVYKKGKIKKGQTQIIGHHGQLESNSMQCTPVMVEGRVTAIDVQCGCGTTQRIHLKYDKTV